MKRLITGAALIVLSGCSYFQHEEQQPQTLRYTCGTMPLTVVQDNARQEVSLILDGTPLTLKQQAAASGTRYADENYVFWSKGDEAFIERNDKVIINDCRLNNG